MVLSLFAMLTYPPPMTHPLALPEIANLIASFLSSKAFFRCIQVSKQWRLVFFPYLWSILSIPGTTLISQHSFERLSQNAALVKILGIEDLWDVWCLQILRPVQTSHAPSDA